MLQDDVDRLRMGERPALGGMVLLGSLHTEMMALLEDRRAPLFGRLSSGFDLGHLDAPAILHPAFRNPAARPPPPLHPARAGQQGTDCRR